MSPNVELVQKMLACFAARDADGLGSILHEDARHTAPGSDFGADMTGRTTIVDYFKNKVWSSFERKTTFDAVHWWEDSEQSAVILEWRSHVRPKTGKDYSNTGVFVVEIRDGLIYWVREYFDTEKANKHVNP